MPAHRARSWKPEDGPAMMRNRSLLLGVGIAVLTALYIAVVLAG
jgi:hypothetical protein